MKSNEANLVIGKLNLENIPIFHNYKLICFLNYTLKTKNQILF